jgi:hypothetical protein
MGCERKEVFGKRLYATPYIVTAIKCRRMRLGAHVARMGRREMLADL